MQKAKLNFPLFFLVVPADNPTPPTNTPSDGANIVLRSGTITDGMLWDISLNCRTGYYVIKPKSSLSTNTVLGSIQITAEEAINGSALALQQYYDNSVYNDEWNIYPVDCRITVYHYFDLAFRNQYGEDFYEDVNILHLKMAEFFLQEYRLLLPATYTSYVSAGDRGETTVSKGIRDEMVDIYIYINEKGISSFNPVEEKCVLISWTGSITGAGNAVPNQRTIVIPLSHLGSLPFTSSDSFALDCLLHEFGHTFDCVDHYCKNGEDPLENCGSEHCDFHAFSYPTERECEMSSWSPKYPAMREKMAEDIYCDECSSKIKTDLNNFPLEVD